MKITFIGNCQTISLCYFFQLLLSENDFDISWISFGEQFLKHLNKWSEKCKNKITDFNESIKCIKDSDVIIYQNISSASSSFCNTDNLNKLNENCKKIIIPCIYFDYSNFDNSIKELINREKQNNVDIKVSDIFIKYKHQKLILKNVNHPNTFLFMEIMKIICNILNINFFNEDQYNKFIENNNYMELP